MNWTEKRVRDKFADIFMSRTTGNNLTYAELCLYYGKEKFLDCAEKICREHEAWDILQKLHRLKIKYVLKVDFEAVPDFHEYLSQKLINAGVLLDETIQFCDRHSTDPNYSAKNYLEISRFADEAINNEIVFTADEEFAYELNLLYGKIFRLIESAAENLSLATEPSAAEKIKLLEKVRDFYDANDYFAMYRAEHFSDPEKQYFYQTEIDKLKPKGDSRKIIIDATEANLCDLAFDYETKGDFDKAIEFFEKAFTLDEESYDYVLYAAARVCKKASYTERAIENLKRILEIDCEREQRRDPNFIYTCHACSDLTDILFKKGRFDEAQEFSMELIRHSEGAENSYEKTYLVVGWYNLYRLEREPQRKNFLWENCLEKFKLLDDEDTLSGSLRGFLKTYAEKLPCTSESLTKLYSLIKRTEKSDEEEMNRAIFERAIEISDEPSYVEYHIKFLTEYALYLSNETELYEEAITYCDQAENFLVENNIDDAYLQSLIYFALAKCMWSADDFSYEQVKAVKQKCNFILLTEKKTERFTDAESYEAWKEAADFYKSFEEHGGRLHCLKKVAEFIDAETARHNLNEFEKFWRLNCEIVECYISLGASEEIRRVVLALYKDLVMIYFAEVKDCNDFNFAGRIKTLADYLENSRAIEEFFALNFFAIYIAVIDNADAELILSPTFNIDEKFFRAFKTTLEKNSVAVQVDFVNDIYERIKSSAKHFPLAEKYLTLIEKFLHEYQFKEIEFKS